MVHGILQACARAHAHPTNKKPLVITRSDPSPFQKSNKIPMGMFYCALCVYKVRDLWLRKDLGCFTSSFEASHVPSHGIVMLLLTRAADANGGEASHGDTCAMA